MRTADRALARKVAYVAKRRRERLAEAKALAGYRHASYTNETGTLVVVLDGIEAGLDTDGGRWSTMCDDHGIVIAHATLALAKAFAPYPLQWCEGCMEAQLDVQVIEVPADGTVSPPIEGDGSGEALPPIEEG